MLNTIFTANLQAVIIQFVALIKKVLSYPLFPENFKSKTCKDHKFLVLYKTVALKNSKRLKE